MIFRCKHVKRKMPPRIRLHIHHKVISYLTDFRYPVYYTFLPSLQRTREPATAAPMNAKRPSQTIVFAALDVEVVEAEVDDEGAVDVETEALVVVVAAAAVLDEPAEVDELAGVVNGTLFAAPAVPVTAMPA